MIFDMHVHQNRHSSDSRLDIYNGIKYAKILGLDGICITDHDSLGLKSLAKELTVSSGIKVIVGVEIYTLDGDILCYGIDEMPERRMSAQETIDFVTKRGGVCVAAHPYRENGRGIEDSLYALTGLSAIEAFNGRTKDANNMKSLFVSKELDMPICGGSDAHSIQELGNYVTEFEAEIKDEKDFIEALKSGKFNVKSLNHNVKEFDSIA